MKVEWKTQVDSMIPERSDGAKSKERFNNWWRGSRNGPEAGIGKRKV